MKTTNAGPVAHYRNLTPEQYKGFYKSLLTHNYSEAAAQIGMGEYYEGAGLRTAGYQIFKDIEEMGIDKLGIEGDIIDMVQDAIESRKIHKGHKPQHSNELDSRNAFTPTDMLDPTDTRQVVLGGRNKAFMLLHKKMDMINGNKQMLKDTSLSQLGTLAGIMFDKGQIIQGQATENISVLSKNIKDGMSPEDTLDMILKMREKEIADKAD